MAGLERALLKRPELFVGTLTEKLLTFALGRGVEYLRRAGDPQDRPRRPREGLSLLVADRGDRDQHAVSDEEIRMIVTKKALPRRTFLRGLGTTLALPLLDAMIPAMTALAGTPAAPARLRRLGFVYMPMGCDVTRWTPPGADTLDELSPILSPLAPVKQHVTAITNLELRNAYPGTHATSNAAFLSAARAKLTESTDYYLGTTVDQIAAQQIGQETQLPSLELSMDLLSIVGQCDNGYACVYQNNLSWSSPTTPLPAEAHPRIVFERLFGEGGSAADRRAALQEAGQPARLGHRGDRPPEEPARARRIAPGSASIWRPSARSSGASRRPRPTRKDNALPDLDRPVGVPAAYADHARLMFDLQVLALQGDVTRVITFQLARETSTRTYPEIGVSDPHHPLTHHGNDPEKIAKMAKINQFHVSLFAEFLAKLKATPEGDGSLLDHCALPLRQRDGQPERPRPREPADPRRRRRGRQDEGRAPHPLREADAAGQPPPDAARQGGRPPRLVRRQPGQGRRAVRTAFDLRRPRLRQAGRTTRRRSRWV